MPEHPIALSNSGPVPIRPFVGLTLLLVEDSRFTSDAVRLLALRSGARLRRADCLSSADRHLRVYSPDVLLVDLGLPDGRGEDLIARLSAATPRVPAIIALSGEDYGAPRAMAAGADGFIAKPIESLIKFQKAILAALPAEQAPRECDRDERNVQPDPIALTDDLRHAAQVLSRPADSRASLYIAQFLGGIARSAGDPSLEKAAHDFQKRPPSDQTRARLAGLVQQRLGQSRPV